MTFAPCNFVVINPLNNARIEFHPKCQWVAQDAPVKTPGSGGLFETVIPPGGFLQQELAPMGTLFAAGAYSIHLTKFLEIWNDASVKNSAIFADAYQQWKDLLKDLPEEDYQLLMNTMQTNPKLIGIIPKENMRGLLTQVRALHETMAIATAGVSVLQIRTPAREPAWSINKGVGAPSHLSADLVGADGIPYTGIEMVRLPMNYFHATSVPPSMPTMLNTQATVGQWSAAGVGNPYQRPNNSGF